MSWFGWIAFACGCGVDAAGEVDVAGDSHPNPPASYDLLPPAPADGFQVDLGTVDVAAGAEDARCRLSPIPQHYGVAPVHVRAVASRFSKGTHHFMMSYRAGAAGRATDPCGEESAEGNEGLVSGDGFKMVLGTGEGAYEYSLPAGYAIFLESGAGTLRSSWHLLNTDVEPVEAFGVLNLYTAEPDEVHRAVRALNCLLTDVRVEAHASAVVSATCIAPFDLDLVMLSSHAHQHLTRFETRLFDGVSALEPPIYVSEDWDSPDIVPLAAPIRVAAGQGLTFSCHYQNQGDEPLSFGTGASREMCATMNGYAYPQDGPDELPPPLAALVLARDGHATLEDTSDLGGAF